jgi:phosphate transport system substrate-binding protein
MNRTRLTGLMVWCVLLIAGIQSLAVAADRGSDATLVRVRGANAMARVTDEWARAFSAANPGETVIVAGGGTDAGFDALFDKAADLVMASRKVLIKEVQAAVLNDCRLGEAEVCPGAVAVVTHPSNPVKDLTLEQLAKIFKGEITNWKDVGGPDQPITVYMGQPISGTAEFLRQSVLGNEFFSSDAKVRDFYHHIIKELARKQPPALAYAPFVDAVHAEKTKTVKILGLKKDRNSPTIFPSEATIKDKSYPLMLPLYFYWNSDTAGPQVRKFVEFCKSRCAIGR